jgi:hypothetical protein
LIALRDARQRAEALITARYADGLLDNDELDHRLERLYAAGDLAEIDTLAADLVDPAAASTHEQALVASGSSRVDASGSSRSVALVEIPPAREITAMFSSLEQTGAWVPARRTRVVDWFSEAVIDLREAVLGPGPCSFEVNCVCASLRVIVPPGLAVRVEASMLFSALERDPGIREHPLAPDDPLVLVTGRVLFSSFELRERLVGESKRQAKRRHKALRKAQERRNALARGD